MVKEKESDKLLSVSRKNTCLRCMSLLAGGFAHSMLASNLIFYVYINDIKAMYHYNQKEVEVFASMLNAGIGLGFVPNLLGRKLRSTWILVFGLVLSTAGLLLLWSSSKLISFYEDKSWLMAIYFLISGLGGSVAYIMALRFNATHFADDKRGRVIALMFVFIDLGMICFTLIYYRAFDTSNRFQSLMIVLVSFNAAVYVFCMIFLRSPNSTVTEMTVEKCELQRPDFNYQPIDKDSDVHEQSFRELLVTLDYHLLAWFCSSTFAVSLLLSNNMTTLTREENLSSFDTMITLLYPSLVITTALTFSVISDKTKHCFSRTMFLVMGGICLSFSSILNAFLSSNEAVVVTAVVFGALGTGIIYTIGPTTMSELFHIENFMRNWGLVMLMRAIFIIILHLIFGAMYDLESGEGVLFCKGLHCTRNGYVLTFGVAVVAVGLSIGLIIRRNIKAREFIRCLGKRD